MSTSNARTNEKHEWYFDVEIPMARMATAMGERRAGGKCR